MVQIRSHKSPWLDWLAYWSEARDLKTDGQLEAVTGVSRATISAWFNRGTRPEFENVIAVADGLKRPKREALEAWGYRLPDGLDFADAPQERPPWVERIASSLANAHLTESEARLVEAQVRGLLQLREERAAYDAEPPSPATPE